MSLLFFFFNLVGYFILISWLGGEVGCNPLSTHAVINSEVMNDEDFKELTLQHSCVNFFTITFTCCLARFHFKQSCTVQHCGLKQDFTSKGKSCFFIVTKLSSFSAHLHFVFDIDEKVSY